MIRLLHVTVVTANGLRPKAGRTAHVERTRPTRSCSGQSRKSAKCPRPPARRHCDSDPATAALAGLAVSGGEPVRWHAARGAVLADGRVVAGVCAARRAAAAAVDR